MNKKQLEIFVILTTISVLSFVMANILAVKLWNLPEIPISIDGGIVIFPILYVVGDVICEFFGKKRAIFVTNLSMAMMILVMAILQLVVILPGYENHREMNTAFAQVFSFAPRIMLASLMGYGAGQIANVLVFEKIRQSTQGKRAWLRVAGSILPARFLDVAVFETMAFYGVLSTGEFIHQATLAFVLGLGLEIILIPVTVGVIKVLNNNLEVYRD